MQRTLRLPTPHSTEQKLIMQALRSKGLQHMCVANGTKFGKSISAAAAILIGSWTKRNGMFRWVAPLYSQSKIGMRYCERMLPPDKEYWQSNNSDLNIKFIKQNTTLQFWHGSNAEALEGEGVDGYIFDEAAKMKPNVFASAKTTTTVTRGPIIEISTPNGKNHFYERCMECQAEMKYALDRNNVPKKIFLTAPSSVNPAVSPEVLEEAAKSLPERLFRQYFLAEFVDEGAVFVNVREMIDGDEVRFATRSEYWVAEGADKSTVVIGVDWAKMQDYTVFWAFDITGAKPRCVGFHRFQNIQYLDAIKALVKFSAEFYNIQIIYHDRTGVGEALDELLGAVNLPFHGVTLTNQNKTTMISNMIFICEQKGMILPNWPAMITEMDSFEVTHTTTGLLKYSAPSGFHDDIVIAIMLAYAAYQENKIGSEILTMDQLETGPEIKTWYDHITNDEDDY